MTEKNIYVTFTMLETSIDRQKTECEFWNTESMYSGYFSKVN